VQQGWISIHRKIQDSAIWNVGKQPFDYRSAWIDLILLANHEEREIVINGDPLVVGRGQRFTSIRKLAEKWHWSRDKVSRYLDMLVRMGSIYKDTTHNGTLLTIVNYDDYQNPSDTKSDTDKATVGTKVGRTRDTDKAQTIMNNNDNNENNENKGLGASPQPDPKWEAWE
jgi:DNA replication protein DnaD